MTATEIEQLVREYYEQVCSMKLRKTELAETIPESLMWPHSSSFTPSS